MKKYFLTLAVGISLLASSCKRELEDIAPAPTHSAARSGSIGDIKILQFDPVLFKTRVDTYLNTQGLSGYAYAVFVNGQRVSEAGGWSGMARKNIDAPGVGHSPIMRQEIASCSKYITTLAMIQMLERANLSLDTPIWPFVPSYMDPAPNFKNISFRQLLSHHTGLIGGIGDTQISLAEMQQTIEGGINFNLYNNYQYNNMNFALCRLLLPYVYWKQVQKLGMNQINSMEANLTNLDTQMANVFLSFVRQDVFKEAGLVNWQTLGAADPTPPNNSPALYYNNNQLNFAGVTIGGSNDIRNLGSVGFDLNANELAQITAAAHANKIVSEVSMNAIRTGYKGFPLGFNNSAVGDHGTYFYKYGDITQNSNNRSGGLATMLVDFGSNNVQVAVVANQNNTNVSNISWIRWAFDNSWN